MAVSKFARQCSVLGTAMILALSASPLHASNAYYLNGWGSSARAMAGSGVALAEDAMVMSMNPAGLAGLQSNEWIFGATFFTSETSIVPGPLPPGEPPPGSFPLRPGKIDSDPDTSNQFGEVFPIPFGAVSWQLDDKNWVGLALYGNGGLNTTFRSFENNTCPANTPQRGLLCFGTFAADVSQVFISPTYARQVTPWLRLGISPLLVVQNLEVRGVGAFAPLSRDPDNLTNNGHDYAFGGGVKVGGQAQLAPWLSAGVTYQSRIFSQKFDDYSGLLAEQGDFDIPPYVQLGLAWEPTSRLAIAADVQRIYFSHINALHNSGSSPGRFGDDDGPGFGWRDATSYKLGVRYYAYSKWTLRAGFAYTDHVVKREEIANTLLTLGIFQEHFNTGFSYQLNEHTGIDVSLVYVPQQDISGPNARFPAQQILGETQEFGVDLAWRHRF